MKILMGTIMEVLWCDFSNSKEGMAMTGNDG